MNAAVRNIIADGNDVFVIANSPLPEFKEQVLATFGPRKTRRQNPDRAVPMALAKMVREELNLDRKHLNIHALVPLANGGYQDVNMSATAIKSTSKPKKASTK